MTHKITEEQAKVLHEKYDEIKKYLEEISGGKKYDVVIACHEYHDPAIKCDGATLLSDMPLHDQLGLLALSCRTVEITIINEQIENMIPDGVSIN